MIVNNQILLGKANEEDVYLSVKMLNRHGLITGASGTGKTVTLKGIAEGLSNLGVPTFIADIKGDLTGMITDGNLSSIQSRVDALQLKDFTTSSFPVHFFDVFRQSGCPIRTSVEAIEPSYLSRILSLTDAQEGILHIVYECANDLDLDLIDLDDLQAMLEYVGEHAKELTNKYGAVSKQSVGGIQRKLLQLKSQNGQLMFGMPELDIQDLLMTKNGKGVMNILECEELVQNPMLYSTFMLWMLNAIEDSLEEVGDLEKPRMVFFFDEAHLLFENTSKELVSKITQLIKLIRSKGVGIIFCSQSPMDIPDEVLGQLSNRIQHSLRAYTPSELKDVKAISQSFRENPAFDTFEAITSLKTGEAIVSCLDEEGIPSIAQRTMIVPPQSSMKASSSDTIHQQINQDSFYQKYKDDIDPESAYEKLQKISEEKKELELHEKQLKEEKEVKKQQQKQQTRIARKITNRIENEVMNFGVRSAKKFLKGLLK